MYITHTVNGTPITEKMNAKKGKYDFSKHLYTFAGAAMLVTFVIAYFQ